MFIFLLCLVTRYASRLSQSVTNLLHCAPHIKRLLQSTERSELTTTYSKGINAHMLYLTGFNSELFTVYMTRRRRNLGGGGGPPPKKNFFFC